MSDETKQVQLFFQDMDKEIIILICSNLSTRSILNLIQCARWLSFCRETLADISNPILDQYIKRPSSAVKSLPYTSYSNLLKCPNITKIIQTRLMISCRPDMLKFFDIRQGSIAVGVYKKNIPKKDVEDILSFIKHEGKRKLLISFILFETSDKWPTTFHYFLNENGKIRRASHSKRNKKFTTPGSKSFGFVYLNRQLNLPLERHKSYVGKMPFGKTTIRFLPSGICSMKVTMTASKYINFNKSSIRMFDSDCLVYIGRLEQAEAYRYNENYYDEHNEKSEELFSEYIRGQYRDLIKSLPSRLILPPSLNESGTIIERQRHYHPFIYGCMLSEICGIRSPMFITLRKENDTRIYKDELFERTEIDEEIKIFCMRMDGTLVEENITMKDFEDCKQRYNNFVRHFE